MIKLVSNSENFFGSYWDFDDYVGMTNWITKSSITNGRYLVIDNQKERVEFLEVYDEVLPAHIKFDEFSFEEMDPNNSGGVLGTITINDKYDIGCDFWTMGKLIEFVNCLNDGVEVKFKFERTHAIHTVHYVAENKRRAYKFLKDGISFSNDAHTWVWEYD